MSITREQFRLQMDRLSDTFGEKHFPDQREMMMWDTAEGHEYQSVIAVVDQFIRCSKFAPLPQDFSEAMSSATKGSKRKYSLGEPQSNAMCADCQDSGLIRLVRNETFEAWARSHSGSAPCHCTRGRMAIDAGLRKPKHPIDFGPQFNGSWLNSYSVEKDMGGE